MLVFGGVENKLSTFDFVPQKWLILGIHVKNAWRNQVQRLVDLLSSTLSQSPEPCQWLWSHLHVFSQTWSLNLNLFLDSAWTPERCLLNTGKFCHKHGRSHDNLQTPTHLGSLTTYGGTRVFNAIQRASRILLAKRETERKICRKMHWSLFGGTKKHQLYKNL